MFQNLTQFTGPAKVCLVVKWHWEGSVLAACAEGLSLFIHLLNKHNILARALAGDCLLSKEGSWECLFKYIGQNCFRYFLWMQHPYRDQLTGVAWNVCYEITTVNWTIFIHCMLSKYLNQYCFVYLGWHSQRPSYQWIIKKAVLRTAPAKHRFG